MQNRLVKRNKIRTCIRKETYAYKLDEGQVKVIWGNLQKEFGKSQKWGNFLIEQIENPSFILRFSIQTSTITVVKKQQYSQAIENQIHQILGFKNEA